MRLLNKSNRIAKSTVLGGIAFVMMLAPGAAFAHDKASRNDTKREGRQHAAQADATSKFNLNRDGRWGGSWNKDKDKWHRTCEERQVSLNQRATEAKDKSQKRLNGVNIMLSGVETYVAGGVVVNNYESLHTTAVTERTTATNAVEAIVAPDLNCNDDTAAASESTDKDRAHWRDNTLNQTIDEANRALKTYGKSVNTLFDAAVNS